MRSKARKLASCELLNGLTRKVVAAVEDAYRQRCIALFQGKEAGY